MEQIKTAALFKPIGDSFTYQSYLNSIQEGLYNTWDTAVRTGYLTGQTTQQIVRKVLGKAGKVGELTEPGTMQKLRNSVWANTRTALQSFAEETNEQVYRKNEQYFGNGEYKYEYLATLDNRTCLPAGEKVLTPEGYKNIEEIKQGDFVIGGSGETCRVLETMQKTTEELIEIELENGKIIRCTPDHLVLTDRGWVKAENLNETDTIKEKL